MNFDLIGLLDFYRTICVHGGGAKVTEHGGTTRYFLTFVPDLFPVVYSRKVALTSTANWESAMSLSALTGTSWKIWPTRSVWIWLPASSPTKPFPPWNSPWRTPSSLWPREHFSFWFFGKIPFVCDCFSIPFPPLKIFLTTIVQCNMNMPAMVSGMSGPQCTAMFFFLKKNSIRSIVELRRINVFFRLW